MRIRSPFGIRAKLVLLSSFLLVIPWLGYRLMIEMEEFLRQGQEVVVLGKAQALAATLSERPELFDEGSYSPVRRGEDLYIYPVYSPLSLGDRSLVDWGEYQRYEVAYDHRNRIRTALSPGAGGGSVSFRNMVGEYNGSLYAYFKVNDDRLVYRDRDALSVHRSDFLQIALPAGEGGGIDRYVIAPYEPDTLFPYRVREDYSEPVPENRITGQWYESEGGYTVELQIPMEMLGDRLGFAVFDVDDPESRAVGSAVATYRRAEAERLGALRIPTPEIDRIVAAMEHNRSRTQIVDSGGRILLSVGDIRAAGGVAFPADDRPGADGRWRRVQEHVLNPLYYRFLTRPVEDFVDDLDSSVVRTGGHIDSALAGAPLARFRTLADGSTRILEAAHPIVTGGEVMGAVLVDQNMNGLVTVMNRQTETLFNTILAVMAVMVIGLFFIASRLSLRIRRLRDQAEGIIGESGNISNTIVATGDADEIGDLSRSFSGVVDRLAQYTSYLETMSSRLSHELRTPVTVVRSSLENLGMTAKDGESAVYIERAEEGISRLNLILTNMSEATRLEQMLKTSEKERIELREVLHGCVEGYKLAYPDTRFETDLPEGGVHINGVPEYIAQLLDKLIANAVEFSYPDQPVSVHCRALRDHAAIRVSNAGPRLPEAMRDRVFDSMISVRPQEKQRQPHLGMGLHIARLITEFHGGSIRADNRSDREGVVVTVVVPLFYR